MAQVTIDRELLERIDESAICDGTDATISDDLFTQLVAALDAPRQPEGDAVTMADVMRAWEYAEDHPHKYLRGTTNWCAAVAHSLNQRSPSAPATVQSVNAQLLEALNGMLLHIREPESESEFQWPEHFKKQKAAFAAARAALAAHRATGVV